MGRAHCVIKAASRREQGCRAGAVSFSFFFFAFSIGENSQNVLFSTKEDSTLLLICKFVLGGVSTTADVSLSPTDTGTGGRIAALSAIDTI